MKNSLILLEKVFARYDKIIVLKNIDLEVFNGLIVVVGPNGSGKSTLFKIIAGLLKPIAGRVRVLNFDPFVEIDKVSKNIFYLPEKDVIPYNAYVDDVIDSLREIHDPGLVDQYIDLFELSKHMSKKVGELSQGFRRRLHLVEALSSNRKIILLDEPFRGLDTSSRTLASEAINYASRRDNCILVSSHIISRLDPNRVVVLEDGTIKYNGRIEDLKPEGCIILERGDEQIKVCGDELRNTDLSNYRIKTVIC